MIQVFLCLKSIYFYFAQSAIYSGASFIRTLWFPVKIVRIGEASGYLKCYDLSLKKKIINICMYCISIKNTKGNYYI